MMDNILDVLKRVIASINNTRQDEEQAIPDQKKKAFYEIFRAQLQLVFEIIFNVVYPVKPT
jgi:hypothetical protein